MFYKLFNRASTKTTAAPSRARVSQHVIAKKVASGQHSLTPERLARITASAKQREYRERQKTMPRMEIDSAATEDATKQERGDTVAPMHSLSGEQALANGQPCGDSHIPDGHQCHVGGEGSHDISDFDRANLSVRTWNPETKQPVWQYMSDGKFVSAPTDDHGIPTPDFIRRSLKLPLLSSVTTDETHRTINEGEKYKQGYRVDTYAKGTRIPVALQSNEERIDSSGVKVMYPLRSKTIYGNTSEVRLGICVEAVSKLNNRFSVPSDGWIHLAPFGSHPHPTGVVQLIDAKSVDAMVANFAARKASDKNFTGALLDFDHFSQSGDKPSEAGGWIENLAKRNDGMWGQVRWTDVGEKAVNGGRYRLVSPVWLKRNCETLDNGQLRPMVLDSVALTNEPNLKGLTPISR